MTLYEYITEAPTEDWILVPVGWLDSPSDMWSQTFTVGTVGENENHTLETIKLKAMRSGSPGLLNIRISSVDANGKPATDSLSTGSYNGNLLPVGKHNQPEKAEEITIYMTKYVLLKDTKYAIVAYAPSSNASNVIYLIGWWKPL